MQPDSSHAHVSVAIATMNRPEGLARCVTAVLGGPVLPAELVIIDQSADDATETLVAGSGWQAVLPVRYVRQARRGLAASRNAAIAAAAHGIIAFTDDDCVPDAGWVAAIVTAFARGDGADAVTGRVLPLGPERPGVYAVSTHASAVRAVFRRRALPWSVGSGGNAAVRREWLTRIGGFDERFGAGAPLRSAEDMDLFYRLLRAGAVVHYEPDAVVYHERQSGERRLASRPSYGFGMGAFCAVWARRADVYALWILGRWCADRAILLLRAGVRLRWRRVREEWLMLHGAGHGVACGLRLRVNE
jgi:GT2 family glycosyltransferase